MVMVSECAPAGRHRGAHQRRYRRLSSVRADRQRVGYARADGAALADHDHDRLFAALVGWFGFNAGSNLEANGGAALAMTNSFVGNGGGGDGLDVREWIVKGHPSVLGALSGAVQAWWR